jgi:hypothetical protein
LQNLKQDTWPYISLLFRASKELDGVYVQIRLCWILLPALLKWPDKWQHSPAKSHNVDKSRRGNIQESHEQSFPAYPASIFLIEIPAALDILHMSATYWKFHYPCSSLPDDFASHSSWQGHKTKQTNRRASCVVRTTSCSNRCTFL